MTIKLDRSNYVLWLAQLVPVLRSRGLMGIVDGSSPCPKCFLTDDAGKLTDTINPEYEPWIQKDQMILGWINTSLTPAVLSTVARSISARSTWLSLEKRYASQSQNRVLQLRSELLRTTKGSLSVSDFLDKLNAIADNLAMTGNAISEGDLGDYYEQCWSSIRDDR